MFYTYIHRRNDTSQVFYVGKGKDGRAHSRSGRNRHWRGVAAKHGHTVEICAQWPTEDEAFEHERFLVSTFKLLNHPLVNMTDGGEGVAGVKRTPEYMDRQKENLTRFYRENPEAKQRIAQKVRAYRAMNADAIAKASGAKQFVCVETGEIFVSQRGAARKLGTHAPSIRRVLLGKSLHANGFHFKYVEA